MWCALLSLLVLSAAFAPLATGADALYTLTVRRPEAGALVKSPVTFLVEIGIDELAAFQRSYQDKWLCVEVDGTEIKCIPVTGSEHMVVSLSSGPHSCVAFIAESHVVAPQTRRLYATTAVDFTVLETHEFAAYEQELTSNINIERLSEWAVVRSFQNASLVTQSCQAGPFNGTCALPVEEKLDNQLEPVYMVVGVKTRLVDGFSFRQAIRQTWASADTLPSDVRVLFIGCRAPTQAIPAEAVQSLTMEKEVYGDFLTDELDCYDGYDQLPEKVKHFMHFVASTAPYHTAQFVMITDDDVYLRVPVLTAELQQYGDLENVYAGASISKPFIRPDRDPTSRNYLPESVYPMDELPPFALGPHYLLSMDCVMFIADNKDDLKGLGSLDDVSVALWMLTIQVHPQHLDVFRSLHSSSCHDELLSFADLSPIGMTAIHSNLREGRRFCEGMNRVLWDKSVVKKYFEA